MVVAIGHFCRTIMQFMNYPDTWSVQTRLRKMQDSSLAGKAVEIQKYADPHDSTCFYDALKAVYGSQSTSTSPLLNVDGTTCITDKTPIRNRWAEHFSEHYPQQTSRYQRRSYCPPATSWDKHWSRQTTERGGSQEDNQATLYWRSLQAWWWRAALQRMIALFCCMWDEEVIP